MSESKLKWNCNNHIGQTLRDEIIKGDYLNRPDIKPSDVWKNNPLYRDNFKLHNFRNNFNNMKKNIAKMKSKSDGDASLGMESKLYFLLLCCLFFFF